MKFATEFRRQIISNVYQKGNRVTSSDFFGVLYSSIQTGIFMFYGFNLIIAI